jgi:hypothetical protein
MIGKNYRCINIKHIARDFVSETYFMNGYSSIPEKSKDSVFLPSLYGERFVIYLQL